ncbi:MAG: hypothetical protein ACE5G0_13460 [Rhodothermales bacterium]
MEVARRDIADDEYLDVPKEEWLDVRIAAVKKVIDQTMLADFVLDMDINDDTDMDINDDTDREMAAVAAVKKLEDQAVLTQIAKTHQVSDVREAAMGKLSASLRAEVYPYVDESAVEQINDQALLLDIVDNTEVAPHIRNAALHRLPKKEMCEAFLRSMTRPEFDLLATHYEDVTNLRDFDAELPRMLGAQLWSSDPVSEEVLEYQATLAEIAKNSKYQTNRHMAISMLNDRTLLEELAENEERGWIRKAAADRLGWLKYR